MKLFGIFPILVISEFYKISLF